MSAPGKLEFLEPHFAARLPNRASYAALKCVDVRAGARDEVKLLALLGVLSEAQVQEIGHGPRQWGRLINVMTFGDMLMHYDLFLEVVEGVVTKYSASQ
jgi:hypothetical protein